MSWLLFPSSGNHVTLAPIGLDVMPKGDSTLHRARSGKPYKYRWGEHTAIKFDVTLADSATTSVVNSWWNTSTKLLFQEVGKTEVYSVQITNPSWPFEAWPMPRRDFLNGSLVLETY